MGQIIDQSATTGEIARSVQQAAQGIQQGAEHIRGVRESASSTGAAAAEVLVAASELSCQSETLRKEVNEFVQGGTRRLNHVNSANYANVSVS